MKPKFNHGDIIINKSGKPSLGSMKYIEDIMRDTYIASGYYNKHSSAWSQDYIDDTHRLLTEKEKLELL